VGALPAVPSYLLPLACLLPHRRIFRSATIASYQYQTRHTLLRQPQYLGVSRRNHEDIAHCLINIGWGRFAVAANCASVALLPATLYRDDGREIVTYSSTAAQRPLPQM